MLPNTRDEFRERQRGDGDWSQACARDRQRPRLQQVGPDVEELGEKTKELMGDQDLQACTRTGREVRCQRGLLAHGQSDEEGSQETWADDHPKNRNRTMWNNAATPSRHVIFFPSSYVRP